MNEQTLRLTLDILDLVKTSEPGLSTTMRRLAKPVLALHQINEDDIDFYWLEDTVIECLDNAEEYWLDNLHHAGHVDLHRSGFNFTIRKLVAGKYVDTKILIDNLESFRFSIGGFLGDSYELTIYQEGNLWQWVEKARIEKDRFEPKTRKKVISDKMVTELKACMKGISILGWDNEYWDAAVLDGTQWDISIGLGAGMGFKTYGSNCFPRGFDQLTSTLENLGLRGVSGRYESGFSDAV